MGSKTHDFTQRQWGHCAAPTRLFEGGLRARLSGHGADGALTPSDGDYVILASGDRTTRYRLDAVEKCHDPQDQWFADATFAPRGVPDVQQETTGHGEVPGVVEALLRLIRDAVKVLASQLAEQAGGQDDK